MAVDSYKAHPFLSTRWTRTWMLLSMARGHAFRISSWGMEIAILALATGIMIEPLQQGGNATLDTVSSIVDDFALAATNMFRPVGSSLYYGDWYNGTASVTLGTVYTTEVCVRFQWRWLLLPACLLTLNALLLLATLLVDGFSSKRRPIWKSSLLPLLYYGFATPPAVELDRAVDVRHLDAKSKMMSVHLSTMDGSVGFMVDSKHT